MNRALLERWLPESGLARLLKTDLFEEAIGEGLYPLLRSKAERVDAIDVSEAVAAAARLRYPELDARLADVRRLPYEDGAFEAVLSNSTLDHFDSLADVADALRELHRVLVPGGVLLITLDNLANPLIALRNALPFEWLERIRLVPHYVGATCGPRGLEHLLRRAGFEVERIGAVMHVPRVAALATAAVVPRRPLLHFLLACERLRRWPTRYLTGQFVAARAVKR